MNEMMTVGEIREQFQAEWVLVENPEASQSLEVQRGRVLWHSKDRDEVYRKACELQPKRSAFLFTGTIPKDTAVVL